MEALTGLSGLEWALVGAVALGAILVLSSARRPAPGSDPLTGRLIPALAGVALLLFLAARHRSDTRDALAAVPDRLAAIAVAAGVVFVAFAVTDVALRIPSIAAQVLSRFSLDSRWTASAVLLLGLAVGVTATVAIVEKLSASEAAPTTSRNVSVVADYALPGHPTDVVFRGTRDGYVAFAEGDVDHFELPPSPGGALRLDPVLRGLEQPRGLAILSGRLFVSELGKLPCPEGSLRCTWTDLTDLSPHAGEMRILETAKGRILRFTIAPGGALTERRAVVSDLPVVSSEHGVNGITTGPDGRLYVAIGNVDALYDRPAAVKSIGLAKPNLLGTIVAVTPEGTLSVVARGIRNVYDLTFDDGGDLYGADNNGPTMRGWRDEQVLRIRRGANYGYPYEGSYGPHRVQTDGPIWTLDSVGSAGIEWAGNVGLGDGLLIGSEGGIEMLELSKYGDAMLPSGPAAYYRLFEMPGYVTSIEPGADRTVVAAIYSPTGESSLVQLRIEPR